MEEAVYETSHTEEYDCRHNRPLEAFEEFIEEKEAQNKSPQTIHNYRQTFEAFCKFNGFDRHTSVESVNRKVFLDWVNDMAQDKKPVTVNHYLRDVRVFLNWCMDDDHHYIEAL